MGKPHWDKLWDKARDKAKNLTPWTPGTSGKGMVLPDRMMTWQVDQRDDLPYHRDVANAHNIDVPTTDFWIEPSGDVHYYADRSGTSYYMPHENIQALIEGYDPRLKVQGTIEKMMENKWKNMKEQWPSSDRDPLAPSSPQQSDLSAELWQNKFPHLFSNESRVIRSQSEPGRDFHPLRGFEWRLPAIYNHDDDRMYLGKEGMEHSALGREFNLWDPWGSESLATGYVALQPESGITPGLKWFGNPQIPNEEELHDLVEAHHGVRSENFREPQVDAEMWHSSSEEDYERPSYETPEQRLLWQPDLPEGKGFLDTEGNLHTWNALNGEPWMHSDQARKRGVRTEPGSHFYISPQGNVYNNASIFRPGMFLEDIQKQDPRLTYDEEYDPYASEDDLWHEGKVAYQDLYHYNDHWGPEPEPEPEPGQPDQWDDPESRLLWQPGYKGKAFLDTKGRLHTWNEQRRGIPENGENTYKFYDPVTGEVDGGWMHSNQAEKRGVRTNPDSHIYMDENGYMRPASRPWGDAMERIVAQDPRIKDEYAPEERSDDDLWSEHESRTAEQLPLWEEQAEEKPEEPEPEPSGPQVVEGTQERDSMMGGRRPVIYAPNLDKIFLGRPNAFHQNVHNEFPEIREDGDYYEGYAGGTYSPNGMLDWYGYPGPEAHNTVAHAIQPYFNFDVMRGRENGADLDDAWDDDDHYSRVADSRTPYEVQDVPPEYHHDYPGDDEEGFNGRVPIVFKPSEGKVYLGAPNWYHGDLRDFHRIPWDIGGDNGYEGYFGSSNPSWGGGKVSWYRTPTPEEQEGVEQTLAVRKPDVYNVAQKDLGEDLWDDDEVDGPRLARYNPSGQ